MKGDWKRRRSLLWIPQGSRPEIQRRHVKPGGVDDTTVSSDFYAEGLPRWGVASDEARGSGSFEVQKEKAIHIHIRPYLSIAEFVGWKCKKFCNQQV